MDRHPDPTLAHRRLDSRQRLRSARSAGSCPGNRHDRWPGRVVPLRLSGCVPRDFIMAVLLTLGFFPGWIALGILSGLRAEGILSPNGAALVVPVLAMPWVALLVGLMSAARGGAAPVLPALTGGCVAGCLAGLSAAAELKKSADCRAPIGGIASAVLGSDPGRSSGTRRTRWLQPRLRVRPDYLRHVGAYRRVRGRLSQLFAGFYGMLERFQPGAFSSAGTGVTTGFRSRSSTPSPRAHSPGIGRRPRACGLILSVGWALVLFAAVMSSIQDWTESRGATRRKPRTDFASSRRSPAQPCHAGAN